MSRARPGLASLALSAVVCLVACAPVEDPCPPSGEPVPERLCEWGLFTDGPQQRPAADVVPYTVVSNLFTDDALKHRFVRLPPGAQIGYDDAEAWTFPEGTVIAKSFAYPIDARDPDAGQRLLETRLMVREGGEWAVHVYKWDEAQQRATRFVPGTRVAVEWVDAEGAKRDHPYRIPSTEDCKTCHGGKDEVDVLGLRTRQLDRVVDYGDGPENQIDRLTRLGLLDRAPAAERVKLIDPFGDGPLHARARAYLDGNCAHCHRMGGDAQSSGLYLNFENTDPYHFGVCKVPVAVGNGGGGLDYDIVPGEPDASIMIYRMSSTDADIKMPEMGGLAVDEAGLALMRAWVEAMEPADCSATADGAE